MPTAEVAFRPEADFLAPGSGDWFQPGTDVTVSSVQIDNQLERSRQPDESHPADSRPGNTRLTAEVEFTATDTEWAALLPTNTSSVVGGTGLVPTAEWYFSADILDGSLVPAEESLTFAGTAYQQADVEVQQDGPVTVSLSLTAADLSGNSPTAVTQPAPADEFLGHGASLSIDGTTEVGLQSATLSLSGLAERAPEAGTRTPRAYYTGAIEPSLDITADTTASDELERATGGSTTEISDTLSGAVSGALSIENRSATTQTWELGRLRPDTYAWQDLASPQDLLSENVSFHVAEVALA